MIHPVFTKIQLYQKFASIHLQARVRIAGCAKDLLFHCIPYIAVLFVQNISDYH